jgi:hypothetical protein
LQFRISGKPGLTGSPRGSTADSPDRPGQKGGTDLELV